MRPSTSGAGAPGSPKKNPQRSGGIRSSGGGKSVLSSPAAQGRKAVPTTAEISNYGGSKSKEKQFMLTDEWIENMFRKLDLNGDGVLQWEELQQALSGFHLWHVLEHDENRDAEFNLFEFKQYVQKQMKQVGDYGMFGEMMQHFKHGRPITRQAFRKFLLDTMDGIMHKMESTQDLVDSLRIIQSH